MDLRSVKGSRRYYGLPITYAYIPVGMIPSPFIYNGSGILRAIGDSKKTTVFLNCICITNIVLDIVFAIFFHWGVAGVAINNNCNVVSAPSYVSTCN